MSWSRALLIVAGTGVAAASLLALASRAPAELRRARPGPEATDPSWGARFTVEQIERHRAYRTPTYLSFALFTLLELVTLIVLARGPFAQLVARIERWPGGLLVHAALLGVAVALLLSLVATPLAFVRGYAMESAWGLSTQDVGGWLSDRLRSMAVGGVIAAVASVAFFALARSQPKTWWIWGWAAFTVLTALFTFLWPVVVAPLFNKFTPLEESELRARVVELVRRADVRVEEVLVADASRRTTAENAYVAGLGASKQLVLYDTLLEADDDETLFVVAHELGHEKEGHVRRGVLVASVGLLVGFAALAWLVAHGMPGWVGASSIADLRMLPALLLFATVAGLLALPIQNAVSRRFETRADEIAMSLTDDPATAVRVFRRLAFSNLADLRPSPLLVAFLYTHPPIPDRIRAVTSHSELGRPGLNLTSSSSETGGL